MRSYALLIFALAALHARAATIPAPTEIEKKLPNENDALDNVSLDNNASEQELIDQANAVKDVENNLRNSIPAGDVPVKIVEEQPIIKTIALKEDSNDYVPDNDDSANIKRVEIDLKNPGPPQRQEHDSQNPTFHIDRERAVAVVEKSIAESQNTFNEGIQNINLNFEKYFANMEDLSEIQSNIKMLKENVNAKVIKLSDTINSYLKPEGEIIKGVSDSKIKEVENNLKTLDVDFNKGVDMLSEGVELLSILKEDEENKPDKISGKADNENIPSAPTGPTPAPVPSSSTAPQAPPNLIVDYMTSLQNAVTQTFTNIGNSFQSIFNPNQNQNANSTANPPGTFQGISFPNIFQGQNQEQNSNQPQGTAPAGTQSDVAPATSNPGILQSIQNSFQTFFNPAGNTQQQSQQNQGPFPSFSLPQINAGSFGNFFTNILQRPQQINQQTDQTTNVVVNKPAADPVNAPPAPAQGTNSVPAPPPPQAEPAKPAKETQPASIPVQSGPIQQIVQNNPIVKGITHAVQRIQGLSNPSKPRDTPVAETSESKGHGSGGAANGDNNNSDSSGVDIKRPPVKDEPEKIPEVTKGGDEPAPATELNKTE